MRASRKGLAASHDLAKAFDCETQGSRRGPLHALRISFKTRRVKVMVRGRKYKELTVVYDEERCIPDDHISSVKWCVELNGRRMGRHGPFLRSFASVYNIRCPTIPGALGHIETIFWNSARCRVYSNSMTDSNHGQLANAANLAGTGYEEHLGHFFPLLIAY